MLWRPAYHRRIAEIADSSRQIADGQYSSEFGENRFESCVTLKTKEIREIEEIRETRQARKTEETIETK